MSDSLDVVPQESVVDFPSDYKGAETIDAPDDTEEPVSLDTLPESDPPEGDEPEDADPEDTAEAEPDGDAEDDDGEEPEVIEFDFGGNKLEVPKADIPPEVAEKLDGFSKDIWADYTKKSQANAEAARDLQSRAEVLEKFENLNAEAWDYFSQGNRIKSEIEQLSQIDLNSLWQSNPDQARQISDQLSAKQAQLQEIVSTVDQYETQIAETRQAELERMEAKGREFLDRKYKGFSTDIVPKLMEYVIEDGLAEEEAQKWALSPKPTEWAYKAMLYDKMQKATTEPPKSKPAKPVKGNPARGGNQNPDDMSFGELGKLLGIK